MKLPSKSMQLTTFSVEEIQRPPESNQFHHLALQLGCPALELKH
jgi:hypothetical protein